MPRSSLSRYLTLSLTVALGVLLLCSCSIGKDADIGRQGVEQFHKQFTAQQDDAIYDAADPAFRRSLSREVSHEFFSRIRRKMGACLDSKETSYFVNDSTSGTFATLHYQTKCANGELNEQFVWRISKGHALLVSYSANNPRLLTD